MPAQDSQPNDHGAVAVMNEPLHHLALDAPMGRVYWVDVAPGDSTLLHQHNFDYFTVVIGDAVIGNQHYGDEEQVSRVPDGHTFYSHAPFEHRVRNAGTEPFLNFTVTLVRDGNGPDSSLFEDLGAANISYSRIFDERAARAARLLLPAGQSLNLHGDIVVVTRDVASLQVMGEKIQRVLRPTPQGSAFLLCCSGRTRITTPSGCRLVIVGIR